MAARLSWQTPPLRSRGTMKGTDSGRQSVCVRPSTSVSPSPTTVFGSTRRPATGRHFGQCEYVSETDPAVLRLLLKDKPGLEEGYDWVECSSPPPAGQFRTTPRPSVGKLAAAPRRSMRAMRVRTRDRGSGGHGCLCGLASRTTAPIVSPRSRRTTSPARPRRARASRPAPASACPGGRTPATTTSRRARRGWT
jgi:hypothetical protein